MLVVSLVIEMHVHFANSLSPCGILSMTYMYSVYKSDFLKVIIVSRTFACNYKLHMIFCCLFFQDATGGHGADVIVEMLANASLSKDLKLVAKQGRIGVIDHFCIVSVSDWSVQN